MESFKDWKDSKADSIRKFGHSAQLLKECWNHQQVRINKLVEENEKLRREVSVIRSESRIHESVY